MVAREYNCPEQVLLNNEKIKEKHTQAKIQKKEGLLKNESLELSDDTFFKIPTCEIVNNESTLKTLKDKFLLKKLSLKRPVFLLDYSLVNISNEYRLYYFTHNKVSVKKYLTSNIKLVNVFEVLLNFAYSLGEAYSDFVFDLKTNLNDIYLDKEKKILFKISTEKNNTLNNLTLRNNTKVLKTKTMYHTLNELFNDDLKMKNIFNIENDFFKILEQIILLLDETKFRDSFVLKDFYKTCKSQNIKFENIKKMIYEKYLEYSSILY